MDEDAFRLFYERTARAGLGLSVAMSGRSAAGRRSAAGNLLSVSRAPASPRERRAPPQLSVPHRDQSGARHRGGRPRDRRRRSCDEARSTTRIRDSADVANGAARRVDLARAMARLKPRERDLLWLAYAQGSSHKEIAETLGLKTASIKLLLFRARRRLAATAAGGRAMIAECARESEVLEAVAFGRWPGQCGDLAAHAASCAICARSRRGRARAARRSRSALPRGAAAGRRAWCGGARRSARAPTRRAP